MARGSLTESGRRPKKAKGKGKADAKGKGKGAKGKGKAGGGREQEILDAAVDIFHANGYSATSVDDVAAAVGILKGSLYYYMDSKEDLLRRIVEEVHEDVEEIMKEALARTELPPLERLAEYIRAQVDYNVRNIKRVRVYYHDYDQLSPARLSTVRKSRRSNEQSIVDLVKDAKDAGEVPADLNERLATKTFFATIIWMYTWFKPGGGVSAKEFGDFCATFVVNGLRGGPLPKSKSAKKS
jgi:TetR/AcrR family transcriptional regulator, cholesterol catabolism regulator